jgi:hypothetical protein
MTGLRRLGLGLVGLCVVEYLLGMLLNLFVAIPHHHPGSAGSEYFGRAWQSLLWGISHGGLLAAHLSLGILILLGSLTLAALAFRVPNSGLRSVTVLGVLAVVAAGFNGASFLSYGQNVSSMVMAAGLAVALLCFSWVIFRATGSLDQGSAPATS